MPPEILIMKITEPGLWGKFHSVGKSLTRILLQILATIVPFQILLVITEMRNWIWGSAWLNVPSQQVWQINSPKFLISSVKCSWGNL